MGGGEHPQTEEDDHVHHEGEDDAGNEHSPEKLVVESQVHEERHHDDELGRGQDDQDRVTGVTEALDVINEHLHPGHDRQDQGDEHVLRITRVVANADGTGWPRMLLRRDRLLRRGRLFGRGLLGRLLRRGLLGRLLSDVGHRIWTGTAGRGAWGEGIR